MRKGSNNLIKLIQMTESQWSIVSIYILLLSCHILQRNPFPVKLPSRGAYRFRLFDIYTLLIGTAVIVNFAFEWEWNIFYTVIFNPGGPKIIRTGKCCLSPPPPENPTPISSSPEQKAQVSFVCCLSSLLLLS